MDTLESCKTVSECFEEFMDSTWAEATHKGLWVKDVRPTTKQANEVLKWLLDRVGHLTVRDLNTGERLRVMEQQMAQVNDQLAHWTALSRENSEAIRETRETVAKHEGILITQKQQVPPPEPTRQVAKVKFAESSPARSRSPKRKKPDDDGSEKPAADLGLQQAQHGAGASPPVHAPPSYAALAAALAQVGKDNEWTTVKKRPRARARVKGVKGIREDTTIKGGSGTVDLVAEGLRADGSADTVKAELISLIENSGVAVNVDQVMLLGKDDPGRKTYSYKFTIKIADKEVVTNENFWPKNVYVRKFVPSRRAR